MLGVGGDDGEVIEGGEGEVAAVTGSGGRIGEGGGDAVEEVGELVGGDVVGQGGVEGVVRVDLHAA